MKKIIIGLIIICLIVLAGCTDTKNTEWYEVTGKNTVNGNHSLILDGIRTINVDEPTFNKIQIGDKVEVSLNSDNIARHESKSYKEQQSQKFLQGTLIVLIFFIVVALLIFVIIPYISDRHDKRNKEDQK